MFYGYNPERLSESLQFLTSKILERLGIEDDVMVGKTIEQIDQLDIEVTIAKVIKENTDDSTKSFSITL